MLQDNNNLSFSVFGSAMTPSPDQQPRGFSWHEDSLLIGEQRGLQSSQDNNSVVS